MTNPDLAVESSATENALEWLEANQRLLSIAAAVILVAGAGYWFVLKSRADRALSADKGLQTAKHDVALGNAQLAQSDLTRLVKDYSGTYSGTEGAMVLAQLSYDQGKFAEGIQALQGVRSKAPTPMIPQLDDLIGAGNLGLNKPLDAAKLYDEAAAATTLLGERANERSKAARAYAAGGDTAKARAIWTDLSQDFKNPGIAAEARVRLGQANAKAVGHG